MSENLRVKSSQYIDETQEFRLNLMVQLITDLKETHLLLLY